MLMVLIVTKWYVDLIMVGIQSEDLMGWNDILIGVYLDINDCIEFDCNLILPWF